MRVLCVCHAGMVRSQALVFRLKAKVGVDALACGMFANRKETNEMLFNWADVIIILDQVLLDLVPDNYKSKVRLWNLGPDVWGNPGHPELWKILGDLIENNILVTVVPSSHPS